jgi:hypothetical protein
MRVFQWLALVGLLSVLACGGSNQDSRVEAAVNRPVVTRLTAPPLVPELRTFRLQAHVQDAVGISSVELTFDGQRRVWPGEGRRFVRISTELTPTRPGRLRVEVVGVSIAGTPGDRKSVTVEATTEPETLRPSIEKDELLRRVALWDAGGFTKDESYARGPDYGPAIPSDFVPLHPIWWLQWMNAGGPQPYQWIEHCPDTPGVTPNGEVLHCWLARHPTVADNLVWADIHPSQPITLAVKYSEWTDGMKKNLDEAFFYAWNWLESSLLFPIPYAADPPLTQLPATAETADVALDSKQAWELYLATVAHSLALEIGGFVPWSIVGYHPNDLRVLFRSTEMFDLAERTYGDGVHYIGHWMDRVVHAYPKTTFRFFVDQNILRPNHYETITQLLEWSGDNLYHYVSGNDAAGKTQREIAMLHWQYPGMSPVQRVLAGTVRDNWEGVHHWTGGCPGTCRVYVSILRALNIPAYWLQGWGEGDEPHLDGHHAPVFPTIGQTLSHGDDMLNWFQIRASVTPPPSDLSIERLYVPWATFVDWFYTNPDGNVGRQKHDEVPIDVLPDDVMDLHCADRQDGIILLNETRIYDRFSDHYSVGELFGRGVWIGLAAKRQQLNWCP